jgi:hypothetical protein
VNWVRGADGGELRDRGGGQRRGFTASVAFHNASAGSVHAIVDIFGYFV